MSAPVGVRIEALDGASLLTIAMSSYSIVAAIFVAMDAVLNF